MPSFDIVSRTEMTEVDNALAGVQREIATRFDFKGSKCTIERAEAVITILADDDLKLKQMHELLKAHATRRKVDAHVFDFGKPEKASGNAVRQTVTIRQGIDAERVWVSGRTVLASWHAAFTRMETKVRVRERGFSTMELDDEGCILRMRDWSLAREVSSDGAREPSDPPMRVEE